MLRLTPIDGEPWDVAIGAPNWWRTPDPRLIAVISDWSGYLLDVVDRRIAFAAGDAIRVTEDELHDLLLFVGFSTLTAVGGDGVAWTTKVPDADDIKVVRIDPRGIVCTAWVLGEPIPEFVIDPATGSRL